MPKMLQKWSFKNFIFSPEPGNLFLQSTAYKWQHQKNFIKFRFCCHWWHLFWNLLNQRKILKFELCPNFHFACVNFSKIIIYYNFYDLYLKQTSNKIYLIIFKILTSGINLFNSSIADGPGLVSFSISNSFLSFFREYSCSFLCSSIFLKHFKILTNSFCDNASPMN